MTDTDSIKNDIAYVRAVAEHTNTAHVPAIYLIWAGICVCGFSLVDLVGPGSSWIGMYWLITGPGGGALSWWLAVQAGNRAGQVDRRKGKRWAGHFLGFFAIGLLGCALAAAGELSWSGLSLLWILLLALTYFLAGLHLERRLLPVGLVLAVGYLFTLFLPEYRFTTAGVLVAVALVVQALLGRREQHATN